MKILALDGGGVLGIGQAMILQAVNWSKFDAFVGTSIGAMNCAYLLAYNDASKFVDYYDQVMPKIFAGNWWRHYNPVAPKYPDAELNATLQARLPGTLGGVHKPFFINAVDLDTERLKVYNSLSPDDASLPLWEVVRAAVAAETYFTPWHGMADGGIFANCPAMVGIAAASSVLHARLEDIEVCSIGTGVYSDGNPSWPAPGKSVVNWGLWLLPACLDGAASSMHEYFARSLPLKRFERIQFRREDSWNFDSPSDMQAARAAWAADVQRGIAIVNSF